ncbi:MAG TPA: hypothetical protein VGL69_01945 [Solirubrobacteraceae bacterium]|jgi:hypothetical protein
MTTEDRDGLIARIRQVRRLAQIRSQAPARASAVPADRMGALETRMAHLEQMVEGLQDSVYREAERQDKLIAEIQTQVEPGAMGAALADNARHRGL